MHVCTFTIFYIVTTVILIGIITTRTVVNTQYEYFILMYRQASLHCKGTIIDRVPLHCKTNVLLHCRQNYLHTPITMAQYFPIVTCKDHFCVARPGHVVF